MFQHSRRPVSYDEFAFSCVVSWCEPGISGERFTGVYPLCELSAIKGSPFMMSRAVHPPRQPCSFSYRPLVADHSLLSGPEACVSGTCGERMVQFFQATELGQMDPVVYLTCTERPHGRAAASGQVLSSVRQQCRWPRRNRGSLPRGNCLTNRRARNVEMTLAHHARTSPASGVQAFGCM